jgi:malonate transporter
MIGIALVQLAYGKEGLVTLLTLVSLHAIVVLTTATIALELAVVKDNRAKGIEAPHLMATAWSAFKNALIHPVPLPIICGLVFAQTGWTLPMVVDKPLQLLGVAFGPMSLLLVGVTMAHTTLRGHLSAALWITASKNVLFPLMVGISAWAFGIVGLPLTVLVVTAALPMGANVFLLAQRYEVAREITTASMALSTVVALFSLSVVMVGMSWLV